MLASNTGATRRFASHARPADGSNVSSCAAGTAARSCNGAVLGARPGSGVEQDGCLSTAAPDRPPHMHNVQDAAPQRHLAAFFHPSCPSLSRNCSTSSGQDPSASPPDYVPPEGASALKKHGILVTGGPRTMIREDVLDLFARHNLQVPPEAVTPFYQRRPGEGFAQHGWAVQLFTAGEVAAALRSSNDKVVRPASPLTAPHLAGAPVTVIILVHRSS